MMKSTAALALLAAASSAIKTEMDIYPNDPKLTGFHHQSNDSLSALKDKLQFAVDECWFECDYSESLQSEVESLHATATKDFKAWNNALSAATEEVANLFVPTKGGSAIGCDNKKVAAFLDQLWAEKVDHAVKRLEEAAVNSFFAGMYGSEEFDTSLRLIDEYDEYVLMIENEEDKPKLCEAAGAWVYDEEMIYPKDHVLEQLHHDSNDSLVALLDELANAQLLTKQGDFSYGCSGSKDKVESALAAATSNFDAWNAALYAAAEDVADLGCDNKQAADFLKGLWYEKVENTIDNLAIMVQEADMNLKGQDFENAFTTLNEYDEVVILMESPDTRADFCKAIAA